MGRPRGEGISIDTTMDESCGAGRSGQKEEKTKLAGGAREIQLTMYERCLCRTQAYGYGCWVLLLPQGAFLRTISKKGRIISRQLGGLSHSKLMSGLLPAAFPYLGHLICSFQPFHCFLACD